MRYVSTRGGGEPQGFFDVLLGGLAPDGGSTSPTRGRNCRRWTSCADVPMPRWRQR